MNWQNGFSLNKAMIVIAAIPIDDAEMPLCARRTRQGNRTTLTSSSSVARQITPIPQQNKISDGFGVTGHCVPQNNPKAGGCQV